MGPGTIRCLAHSAWPMLWVRQCALSPYPPAAGSGGAPPHCSCARKIHRLASPHPCACRSSAQEKDGDGDVELVRAKWQ